ncbi:hypothetical protein MAM1_0129d06081 [Mucor ambiguus]|uniref:DUF3824 domain-containing protein n=1 Tax=Mucor ambiguus TaxID=91626 RepID=A0A0C9MGZ4_9FUNG|nr:hypothetical protein MAM1_0129d06081 [Mucor ambiguus]
MLSNQDNTQMPGAMPGSMPGSMPENNNTTHNALNQDAKPSIGGPSKIQSGVSHHELPVNNTDNVHNNTHGEHNFSKDKSLVNNTASGMTGHQNDVNPLHSDHGENSIANNNDHHYKRDAAAAGAAGLAGHELKDHHDQSSNLNNHSTTGNPLQSGLGHNGHEGVSNNPLHSEAGLGNHHTSGGNPLHYGSSNLSNDNDHHYKRDAALGAGAAGLAGHELKDHHGNANPLQPGIGHKNHESINQSNPLHSEAGLGHTSAGNPLHPGSNNLSSDNDHHYKRDAALGAGAAGLAGHELKNHQNQQFGFANHRAGNNPIQSGLGHNNHEGINNPHHSENDKLHQSSSNNDHHYKRDAALGAGAAGLAGHELKDRHGDANPLQSGVGNNNYNGNLLHSEAGLDNPIHPGSNTTSRSLNDNNDHHYKRDAALGAGAAGLAGHELKNHHDKQSGIDGTSPLHSKSGLDNHHSATGNPLHSGSEHLQHSSNDNDHHYKRDAALGAGAAGLAGHELKNHHDNQIGIDNHHNGTPMAVLATLSIPRDAAIGAGAAGAAGAAGHEMKEHHDKKEAASGRTSVSSASSGEKKGAAVHDKPLNTGGDAHHVAEQPPMGLGGLTGKQPVGEINFHKLS